MGKKWYHSELYMSRVLHVGATGDILNTDEFSNYIKASVRWEGMGTRVN